MNTRTSVVITATGFVLAGLVNVTSANASVALTTSPAVSLTDKGAAQVDEARVQLSSPMTADSAAQLAELASPDNPIEIIFSTREWTGGLVLSQSSNDTRTLVQNFLRTSKAATGARPIIALKGSETAIRNGALAHFAGTKSYRSQFQQDARVRSTSEIHAPQATGKKVLAVPCQDCDVTINGSSTDPGVPANGQLKQFRQQGFIERTHHELKNFSNKGYPATLHFVGMTGGHGGTIKPAYIYEHDYKITNNGYTSTDPSYDWTTNLPGAYRDTRARGLEGGDKDLDFTVGSVGSWLLDGSKTYTIDTDVLSGATASSTARLTASVIPNDGAESRAAAAAKLGCKFAVDPSTYPAPASYTPSSWGAGDLAWCGGIGDFVTASFVKNISLISLSKFGVTYTGTCRNWKVGAGFTSC